MVMKLPTPAIVIQCRKFSSHGRSSSGCHSASPIWVAFNQRSTAHRCRSRECAVGSCRTELRCRASPGGLAACSLLCEVGCGAGR